MDTSEDSVVRFDIAKKDINNFFDDSNDKAFSFSQLSHILQTHTAEWRLSGTSARDFIALLTTKAKIKKHDFRFQPAKSKKAQAPIPMPLTVYSWGDVSVLELASILGHMSPKRTKKDGYFTHYTAVYLHGLTNQLPKSLYLNFEQNPKQMPRNPLIQANIDRAFTNPQRTTTRIVTYKDFKVYLLNGKHTKRLGVTGVTIEGRSFHATDLERTLIDITVRPAYAGGVFEVFEAYKTARDRLSVNRLLAYLKKMDYIYPYHQAIGFYLERAGYRDAQLALVEDIEKTYDFYLTHQMHEPEYSARWRLYHPKGL